MPPPITTTSKCWPASASSACRRLIKGRPHSIGPYQARRRPNHHRPPAVMPARPSPIPAGATGSGAARCSSTSAAAASAAARVAGSGPEPGPNGSSSEDVLLSGPEGWAPGSIGRGLTELSVLPGEPPEPDGPPPAPKDPPLPLPEPEDPPPVPP